MTIYDPQNVMEGMTWKELQELLDRREDIIRLPGVLMIQLEYLDREKNEVAVVVHVDYEYRDTLAETPEVAGGLPVIVELEDQSTHEIVEVIDLRRGEPKWASWTPYGRSPRQDAPANADLRQGA
jgi:hypothetical protein